MKLLSGRNILELTKCLLSLVLLCFIYDGAVVSLTLRCKSTDQDFRLKFISKYIYIYTSVKFVPQVTIDKTLALVKMMVQCQTGDNPLSEPVMSLLTNAYMCHSASVMSLFTKTHICVIRPRLVNRICYVSSDMYVSLSVWFPLYRTCKPFVNPPVRLFVFVLKIQDWYTILIFYVNRRFFLLAVFSQIWARRKRYILQILWYPVTHQCPDIVSP